MLDQIFIISANKKSLDTLCEFVITAGFSVVGTAHDGEDARRKVPCTAMDIIIINAPLTNGLGDHLAKDLTYLKSGVGLIIATREDSIPLFTKRLTNDCAFILPKPISRQNLLLTIGFMQQTLTMLTLERERSSKLEKKLDDLKLINRAKHVLMGNLHLTEQQAHNHIQKQAMDMRLTPREIAESILNTYEF